VYYWIKYETPAETVRQLLAREPASYDIADSVNSELKWSERFNRQQWKTTLQPLVQDLKQTAQELERRGCRILLFELPAAPGLREAAYVHAVRDLVKQAFPGADQWLQITDPGNELRWVDGSHMDERSAVLVARQIDRHLAAVKPK
jgi:ribosomal protein S12 methylthiotransferase accessory factor YcaO